MRNFRRFSVMALPAVLLLGAAHLVVACAGVDATDPTDDPGLVVRAITVAPNSVSAPVGSAMQFSAQLTVDGTVDPLAAISWQTTDDARATVSSSGMVNALQPGTVFIRATSGTTTGQAELVVTAVAPVVASVAIVPSPATVTVGQTITLAATARDGNGAVIGGRTFAWSSSNTGRATVSGAGVVTGQSAGTVTITAETEGVRGEVVVTVTAVPPAPVATVTVAPATASLSVGGTRAFTATLRSADGTVLTGRPVTWSSSNTAVATMSSGTATATGAGSATITATSEGRTGTATLTVTAAPPAARVDTIFRETFESGSLAAWEDGLDPAKHRIVNNSALAHSGSRVLDVTYPSGQDGGWLTHFFMPGYDSVYVSYWVRFPSTWVGSTKLIALYGSRLDNQWSAFGKAGVRPNGTDFMVAFLTNGPEGTPGDTRFYTYFPDMQRDADGNWWGDHGIGRATYHAPLTMTLGNWHFVEFWVKLNTPGQSNGLQRFWMDGVLKGEWTGLRFRDTDQIRLNSVQLSFSRITLQATQHMYVDDILVLTGRPSP